MADKATKTIKAKKMKPALNILEYGIAIRLDHENGTILSYDMKEGEILQSSQSILKTLNPDLAKKIEQHFQIDLSIYDIEIKDETVSLAL